jgi:IclR family acetate operon transcriptional repressor
LARDEAEPGVAAIAAAVRSGHGGAAVGTVTIAGPTARVPESRIRELAPLVMQCASELSSLWPLRPKTAAVAPRKARPRLRDARGCAGVLMIGKPWPLH